MQQPRVLILVLVALFAIAYASSSEEFVNGQKRALVVVDSNGAQETSHSQFLKQLEDRGYKLTIKRSKDSSITLSQFGEFLYDNLIILAGNEAARGELAKAVFLREFLEAGHNIFIAADKGKLAESFREFLNEIGVEVAHDDNLVIDHFNFDTALDDSQGNNKHTVVIANNVSPIFKDLKNPVLFNGLGISLGKDSRLLIPLLTGSSTSYCHSPSNPIESDPFVSGTKTVLVSGYQSKYNGARLTVVGSADALGDKFFDAPVSRAEKQPSGNKQFAVELSKWSFQERGFLRHREVHHYLPGEITTPANYRVSQEMVYTVIIEEWNGDKWVPYIANDIQLEFIMLDPYIRTFLKHEKDGKYIVEFKTPDVYGIFKAKVDYRRPGMTFLVFHDQIVVRPMRINEYERFITAAFPYYASVFSMMAGFFIFGFFFLFSSDKSKTE